MSLRVEYHEISSSKIQNYSKADILWKIAKVAAVILVVGGFITGAVFTGGGLAVPLVALAVGSSLFGAQMLLRNDSPLKKTSEHIQDIAGYVMVSICSPVLLFNGIMGIFKQNYSPFLPDQGFDFDIFYNFRVDITAQKNR